MSDAPTLPAALPVKASKVRVLLFLLLFLLIAAVFVATGLMNRERLRNLGGNLSVTVTNNATEKLRADLYVDDEYSTLEMDPGEFGTIRFNPKKPSMVRMRLYSGNMYVSEWAPGEFGPNSKADVRMVIKSAVEVESSIVHAEEQQ